SVLRSHAYEIHRPMFVKSVDAEVDLSSGEAFLPYLISIVAVPYVHIRLFKPRRLQPEWYCRLRGVAHKRDNYRNVYAETPVACRKCLALGGRNKVEQKSFIDTVQPVIRY